MAELSTLARPYAEAVFRLAREAGDMDGWEARLELLAQIVADDRMTAYLADPMVGAERAAQTVIAVAGEGLREAGANFVQVLAGSGRLPLLPEIRAQFRALKDDAEGVLEADIVSALALDQSQIDALVAALQSRFGRAVHARVVVDAALIGGAVVRVGDRIMDGSVRGRLERMAYALRG